ncbi:type II secretion system protein [Croceimicrobium hydrocarbonivorans]|uniref:Type II secretion system protein n=1 Tax=Croceimicrobium hydrocarbonivorans TaxID=2761580 RepID=A0A7H0VBX6_9FLAO|nr:type II secretion system protein [Croceimicrobium hydrocarbonivorans]QNR23224.1 type II secretion system protein [Croceimicrobium hydrocarbonivorans]
MSSSIKDMSTKLEASTLVENLVAMTVISLVLGFGMMIFLRLNGPGGTNQRLAEVQQVASQYFQKQELDFKLEYLPPDISGWTLSIDKEHKGEHLIGLHFRAESNKNSGLSYERIRWFYVH